MDRKEPITHAHKERVDLFSRTCIIAPLSILNTLLGIWDFGGRSFFVIAWAFLI